MRCFTFSLLVAAWSVGCGDSTDGSTASPDLSMADTDGGVFVDGGPLDGGGQPEDGGSPPDADGGECDSPNACGGCAALTAEPGSACGDCGDGAWECSASGGIVCEGASISCIGMAGAPCSSDADCGANLCSASGYCAPAGWSYAPAGSFTMGAPLDEPGFHTQRENGQHQVILTRGFVVKQTEVTQGEWEALMGPTDFFFDECGADCPAELVNWWEMLEYLNALSARDGFEQCFELVDCEGGPIGGGCAPGLDHCNAYNCSLDALGVMDLDCTGYRLPTEAEWEYFARAGTMTGHINGYDSFRADGFYESIEDWAWHGYNSNVSYAGGLDCTDRFPQLPAPVTCGTHPVGQKLPNPWGLYDIIGNVFERTWDIAGTYPEPGTTVTDPTGPLDGNNNRRIRGGDYQSLGQYLRLAYRTGPLPFSRYYDIGLRPVRTIPTTP